MVHSKGDIPCEFNVLFLILKKATEMLGHVWLAVMLDRKNIKQQCLLEQVKKATPLQLLEIVLQNLTLNVRLNLIKQRTINFV